MIGIELYAPRQSRHRRTWTAAAIVLSVVFLIAGAAIALFPAAMAGFITEANIEQWPQLTYQLAVAFGLGAFLLFLWVWLFERRGLATIGFNNNGLVRFIRGYLVGLAFLLVTVGVIFALGGYEIETGGVSQSLSLAAVIPLLALFVGFIIQGSTEEILFRGWLMQLVASRHGLLLAIIINSLVFSLLHGFNIEPSKELAVGLINILLFGLYISVYAIREQSLWGVCGWHAAWNWLLGVGFGLEVSGQQMDVTPLVVDLASKDSMAWYITGGQFGPEASVITTIVLVIATAVTWMRGKTEDFGVESTPPAQ